MRKFNNVNELVNTLKPENPVYCIRPNSVKKSVEFFKNNFPGKVLYAVKTNPDERIIKIINDNGINNFDVASINEIKLVRKIDSKAKIYFIYEQNQTIIKPTDNRSCSQYTGSKDFFCKNYYNLMRE